MDRTEILQRRVLLLLPQLPQDPASGAARSMRTICRMLADSGARVRSLATTSSEHGSAFNALEYLAKAKYQVTFERSASKNRLAIINLDDGPVRCTLLHTPEEPPHPAMEPWHHEFNALLSRELSRFSPDIVLTFGGTPANVARRAICQSAGAAVVLGLRNLGYMSKLAFEHVDAVLTPSEFISNRYKEKIGLLSVPLPTPIDEEETIAPKHDPIFFTYVNPSVSKGVLFFAVLAERLGTTRPDIPLLVIESRGTAGTVVQAGAAAGFDLRRHRSIHISPGVTRPADIYAPTRALLVPSTWEEPSGRVAAEALINGIPPITSDRGGLPETCSNAGVVLPLPDDVLLRTPRPPKIDDPAIVAWADQVERFADDELAYADACARARLVGSKYQSAALAPRYVDFFSRIRRGGRVIL